MRAKLVLKWAIVFGSFFVGLFPFFNFSDYVACVLFAAFVYQSIRALFFVANRIVSLSHRLTA